VKNQLSTDHAPLRASGGSCRGCGSGNPGASPRARRSGGNRLYIRDNRALERGDALHGNILADAEGTLQIVDIGERTGSSPSSPCPIPMNVRSASSRPSWSAASISYIDKPPTAAVLLPALQQVKPTVMCSVPLIIEKIYKGRVLPELTKSPLLRRAYGISFFRKVLHRLAGKKLMKTFAGRCVSSRSAVRLSLLMWNSSCGSPLPVCHRLWSDRDVTPRCRYRSGTHPLPLDRPGPARHNDPDCHANPVTREGEIQIKGRQ